MKRFLIRLFVIAVLSQMATPAFAQLQPPRQRPERPVRGLFASGMGDTEQSLIFRASLGGGYDDDLFAEAIGGGLPSDRPRSGQFGLGTLGLDYGISRERIQAGVGVSGTARYYPDLPDNSIATYGVIGHASWRLTQSTFITTTQQFSALPNHLHVFYAVFDPGTPPVSSDDLTFAVGRETYRDLRSSVGISQDISRRLALYAGLSYYLADFGTARGDYSARHMNGGLTYRLGQGLSLRGGYTYTESGYNEDGAQEHRGRSVDAGVNFDRALSLTRRTKLGFSTGFAGVDSGADTHYFATGQATLTRELGRSWTVSVGAGRSVSFVQTFGEPVVLDSVLGGASGLLARRLQAHAITGWSRGTVGVVASAPEFNSTHVGGGLRFGLTRQLGFSVTYALYHYDFDDVGTLPSGFTREMKRQSVRVSVDLWAPLVTHMRRNNASR